MIKNQQNTLLYAIGILKKNFSLEEKKSHTEKELYLPLSNYSHRKILKHQSALEAVAIPCKAPKTQVFQKDKLEDFEFQDLVNNFADLNECNAPAGYKCHKHEK